MTREVGRLRQSAYFGGLISLLISTALLLRLWERSRYLADYEEHVGQVGLVASLLAVLLILFGRRMFRFVLVVVAFAEFLRWYVYGLVI